MIYLYRRHIQGCPEAAKERRRGLSSKCNCPIHTDGTWRGQRIRISMDTGNKDRAKRRLSAYEAKLDGGGLSKPVADAVALFLDYKRNIGAPATITKYTRALERFAQFCKDNGIDTVEEIALEHLDQFRMMRKLASISWAKELELLSSFLRFCTKRRWCGENVAADMERPKQIKKRERLPFTSEEIIKIFTTAETMGQSAYERLRMKAMLALLLDYGLRVSDVALFRWDSINKSQTEILLHAKKNKRAVWLPLTGLVKAALAVLPLSEGAAPDCPYLFWNGSGDVENYVKRVGRTLARLMRRCAVENATPHRFRHTVAQDILVNGGSLEDVARILGDDPATIEKHYTHLSPAIQGRLSAVLMKARGGQIVTPESRGKSGSVNPLPSADWMVGGEGHDPPTSCL